MCWNCYDAWLTAVPADLRPPAPKRTMPTEERFWSHVEKSDGCWLWIGTVLSGGYGQFTDGRGRRTSAHRFAYELTNGPVSDGLHLDHLCRVRNCVNPDHLEPVTCRENVLRGIGPSAINAHRTECVNGHEFTPENTYVTPDGRRMCRICTAERKRRHKERRQARAAA